jgi:hypothetical protein
VAFDHSSSLKDLVHLYDALENHVNRLDPAAIRFLRKIHCPGVTFIRTLVLHIPFTASASMLSTMEKIEASISYETLESRDPSDQDLEDFDLVKRWYKTHKKDTPAQTLIVFSAVWTNIQKANTMRELISSIGEVTRCPMLKIRQKIVPILKQKIKDASPQIAELKANEIGKMADSIELLEDDFVETRIDLRKQLNQRIASEPTLSGIVKIYSDVKFSAREAPYIKSCKDKIEELVPSEIERASSVEELWKIEESLAQVIVDCWEMGVRYQISIREKIKKLISSQEDLTKLLLISETLRLSKPNFQRMLSDIRSSILEQAEKIKSLPSDPAETLKNLKELLRRFCSQP